MTPEDLETLVLNETKGSDMVRAFSAMSEKERAKLSTTAQQLHNQLNRGKANAKASDRLKKVLSKRKGESWSHWHKADTQRAVLAVFACGPLTAVKKQTVHIDYQNRKHVEQVISDRRPDWIDDWIDHELQAEFTSLDFPTIRNWIKTGIASKPTADKYYEMFAWEHMRTGHHRLESSRPPPLSQQLLADPDLLEDIEGLFRVETSAFNTNEWLTRGAADDYETWPQALKKLSDDGHYNRTQLLDLAVNGLRSDIKQNQLSGYAKFFKSMEPTEAELTSRQQGFIDLLCHKVGLVQKFAVEMLTKIEQFKQLDDPLVIRELPAVFAGDAKGNAMAALRLLDKVIKRTTKKGVPDPATVETVGEALRHVHPDVQAKAIAILTAHADHVPDAFWRDIADLGGFVAASNQPALTELLSKSGLAKDDLPTTEHGASPESYTPIDGDILAHEVLVQQQRIDPIVDLDELIDASLHCVEVVNSPDDVERLIDGISRLANQRPDDFDKRVAPMLHRINKGTPNMNGLGAASPGAAQAALAVLMTWASGTLYQADRGSRQYFTAEDAFAPVVNHLNAVARRVLSGEAREILSCPTHSGGWIDPLVWIVRLQRQADRPQIVESIDLHRSLIRLAPDNRTEALKLASTISGDLGRIARFALGGEEEPTPGAPYVAWVSAARARSPMRDWRAELATLGCTETWPGGAAPAQFTWSTSHEQRESGDLRWKDVKFSVDVSIPEAKSGAAPARPGLLKRLGKIAKGREQTGWIDLPTAAVSRPSRSRRFWSSELNTVWVSQWLGTLSPLDPSGAFFASSQALIARIDEDSSSWSPAYGFLDVLFVKGRPWGEGGHLLLCLALIGKDADAKGLALDAMIEGIDRRVFDPDQFGEVMGKLLAGGWVKLNRLGAVLTQVARTSPDHALAVGLGLQDALSEFDLSQRNSHHLLEALVEVQAVVPRPLTDSVTKRLEAVQGKGKAAKLAKQLLKASALEDAA